jgi:hypothetical protein
MVFPDVVAHPVWQNANSHGWIEREGRIDWLSGSA